MKNDNTTLVFLDEVDSTNNYAMQQLNAQLAKHGNAYATLEQTAGKGQMGKQWLSEKKMNIALSVVFFMDERHINKPFVFSAFFAIVIAKYLHKITGVEIKLKWPNDIYINDRKAGGILIENKYAGTKWKWAVAGVGINMNQTSFDEALLNAVSLKQITGNDYHIIDITSQLYTFIMTEFEKPSALNEVAIMENYNALLYKKGKKVKLKRDTAVFETEIIHVLPTGQLITKDSIERSINFGEVSWVL